MTNATATDLIVSPAQAAIDAMPVDTGPWAEATAWEMCGLPESEYFAWRNARRAATLRKHFGL